MEFTVPTRMESPNPASHVDRYYMRRVITDNQIELHWHNFFEIDFMDDGYGMHRLNGVERPFSRGTLSVLSPFDFHSYRHEHARKEFMSCFSFHFDDHVPDTKTLARLRTLAGKQLQCNAELCDLLIGEFRLLEAECNGDQPDRDTMVRNILERITLYAVKVLGIDTPPGNVPAEMIYIENNFRQPITLGEAAGIAGYSEDYFGRLFKQQYGCTFQEYLLGRRLQWAYGLLRSSRRSITEIAYEAGFNSHAYFCRRFKKRYGITPLQARKEADSTPMQPEFLK